MSTIALGAYGTNPSLSYGISAFSSLESTFKAAKAAASNLVSELANLKLTIDVAGDAVDISSSLSQVKQAQTREETKSGSLTLAYSELDTYIAEAGAADNAVSVDIGSMKADFYKEYPYLKPECEKGFWEKVGEWCKEHWKIIVVVVLVIVSIVIICVCPASGLLAAALLGAAKGCLMGLAVSAAINTAGNLIQGKPLLSGLEDACFSGAVGGFIGGGISGWLGGVGKFGALGKVFGSKAAAFKGINGLMGPAHSMFGAIAKGAFIGALSGAASSGAVTTLNFLGTNLTQGWGTVSWEAYGKQLGSGMLFGAATGGTIGAITGAISYKMASIADKNAIKRTNELLGNDNKAAGDEFSKHATERLQDLYPQDKFANEITVKNADYNAQYNAQNGTNIRSGYRADIAQQTSGGNIKLFECKASDTATFTTNQQAYFNGQPGINEAPLLTDATFTQKGINIFGQQTISQGTIVTIIKPSNITQAIGAGLNGISFGSGFIPGASDLAKSVLGN